MRPVAAVFVAVALSTPAHAGLMELSASGVVTQTDGFGFVDPVGTVELADAWAVRIVYDADVSPAQINAGGRIVNYTSIMEYEVSIAGQTFAATPDIISVQQFADFGSAFADGYFFFGDLFLNPGNDGVAVELKLFNFDPFLSSTDLPTSLDLADFSDATVDFEGITNGVRDGFPRSVGTVDTLALTVVPGVGTAGMLAAGGIAASRRRR